MKKFLCFLLFALCLTVAANAQPFATYDFESGTISTAFTNDGTYPWIVIDTTDESGNTIHCIRSGNRGVSSSTSAIEITQTFAADGYITFDALIMGEGSEAYDYDNGRFYIDGELQFWISKSDGWKHKAFSVSAGFHTFKWEYKKDFSYNNPGDAFFVDNIVFGVGELCETPVYLKAKQNGLQSVEVSWQSYSSSFNLRYRLVGTTSWSTVLGSIPANTCIITLPAAGSYEVQVAATCDADNWTTATFNIQEISSNATWYGYAAYIENDEGEYADEYQYFIRFSMQNPETIDQATPNTVTNTYAACYANDGYVWCITTGGNLCRATVNNTDHTIGTFETVVAGFEPDNSISMSYNPVDGKIYYIPNNIHTTTIKSFDPADPANTVSDNITLATVAIVFAINRAGEAYYIDYPTGNLYRIDLSNGTATTVGNTGHNTNYVQSMAFDMNTGELFWAQYYSSDDNRLYLVNTVTAETVPIGHIGGRSDAEITGLFMVWDDEDACTIPYQLNVSEVTTTTASVSWTEKGETTSWVVAYKADGATDFTEITVNTTTYTLIGLTPETSYFVKVRPVCEDGSFKWSSVTFTTHGLCDDPSNVMVNSGATTATLTWTGYQEEYNVRYRTKSDTILFEDFEDGLPSDWTTIDHDGDGNDWIYTTSSYSHSGDGIMYSESYAGGISLTPDNWLITPQIELGNIVKVWLKGLDLSYAAEHFAIYLSTMGNNYDDFTITLLPETITSGEYVEYTADLSAYTGQQGYIAIRHFNVTDQYILNLDDFGVYNEEPWTTITATGNTAELTGLDPETTYEVQVQGICESDATSTAPTTTEWTEPVGFTTTEAPNDPEPIDPEPVVPVSCGVATDCDGHAYPTVNLGNVCWMAKNLAAQSCVTAGNFYAYVNDQFPDEDANVEAYGLLYDEDAAMQGNGAKAAATGICPEGYTLPTTEQFEYLKANYTVNELRNSTGWVASAGTNGTGFSWDGAGFRNGASETFEHMLLEGYLWAVDMTSGTPQPAMYKMMYYCNEIVRVYDFDGISASIRCVKAPFKCGVSTVKDHENNEYGTVEIGDQCWTKENMRCETSPSTGTNIVNNTTNERTYTGKMAKWYNNNKDAALAAGYGLLYNWNAAMDVYTGATEMEIDDDYTHAQMVTLPTGHVRGICPEGWHIPSDDEWTALTDYVSSAQDDEGNYMYCDPSDVNTIAKALASETGWTPSSGECYPGDQSTKSNNASGFGAVPTGNFGSMFRDAGNDTGFWSATQNYSYSTYYRYLFHNHANVYSFYIPKDCGYPVRCLRDSE